MWCGAANAVCLASGEVNLIVTSLPSTFIGTSLPNLTKTLTTWFSSLSSSSVCSLPVALPVVACWSASLIDISVAVLTGVSLINKLEILHTRNHIMQMKRN